MVGADFLSDLEVLLPFMQHILAYLHLTPMACVSALRDACGQPTVL